jgi:predicted nucleic acid-binding protein
MRLLLDTSAYSAFMRGHAEIRSVVQANEEIFLSSIIVGELIAGFIKGGVKEGMRVS